MTGSQHRDTHLPRGNGRAGPTRDARPPSSAGLARPYDEATPVGDLRGPPPAGGMPPFETAAEPTIVAYKSARSLMREILAAEFARLAPVRVVEFERVRTDRLEPRVCILEVQYDYLPPDEKRAALQAVYDVLPAIPVLVLTPSQGDRDAIEWFGAGVLGYFPTNLSLVKLTMAVQLLIAGGMYAPSHVMEYLLARALRDDR